MEKVSPNNKIDALLAVLQNEVVLTDRELLELQSLHQTLEDEFGEISEMSDEIFSEFLKLYEKIPYDSPFRVPFSINTPEQKHDREYYEARDQEVLKSLLNRERWILEQWSTYFFKIILPKIFGHLNGEIQNGGIKSWDSINERMASREADGRQQPLNFVRDLLRGRFVGEKLEDVEEAMRILRETSIDQIISVINAYHSLFIDWRGSREAKPFVAANFTLKIDQNLTYELQLLTKRAELIGKLDHSVRIKRKVKLLEELDNFLKALAWGSHLLDLREYLDK